MISHGLHTVHSSITTGHNLANQRQQSFSESYIYGLYNVCVHYSLFIMKISVFKLQIFTQTFPTDKLLSGMLGSLGHP